MKRTLSILSFLLLLAHVSKAQQDAPIELSLSYFSRMGYQPGGKIGVYIPLKDYPKTKKNGSELQRKLFVLPSVGTFTRSGYNLNFTVGGDVGLRRRKDEKKFYQSFSAGIHYMLQSEVMTTTVNFAGDIISREREARHYFLTTFSYELGGNIGKVKAFGRLSPGYRISFKHPNSWTIFVEAGVHLPLQFSTKKN